MQKEETAKNQILRSAFCILTCAFLLAGCSSTDNGRTTRIENRPMTANDPPFGGGFAPSQQPDGDPFGRAGTRNQIRLQNGADNGAPETRVGENGDTRLSR